MLSEAGSDANAIVLTFLGRLASPSYLESSSAKFVWTIYHYTSMCYVKWRWCVYYLDTDRQHRCQAKDAQHVGRRVGLSG